MAIVRVLLGIAIILLALSAPAAASAKPSAAEQAAMKQALQRGRLIFAYDRAAWQGTDDMFAKVENPEGKVGGWIVEGPAEAPTLVFHDKNDADPKAVYVATFDSGKLKSSRVLAETDDRTLSAERRRLIAARDAAADRLKESKLPRCSAKPYNTVILPPETPGGPVLVYFLTPQEDLYKIPFGGHHLIEVDAEGRAGKPRSFTNSCLALPLPRRGEEKPAALYVTHLLDPVPTEIHVFSSLASGYPVAVGTSNNSKVWMVAGSGIRLLQDK